jgi:hypothetical protein
VVTLLSWFLVRTFALKVKIFLVRFQIRRGRLTTSAKRKDPSHPTAPELTCSAHRSFIDLESFEKVVSPIAFPVIIGVGRDVKEKLSAECCHKDKQGGVQAHLGKL